MPEIFIGISKFNHPLSHVIESKIFGTEKGCNYQQLKHLFISLMASSITHRRCSLPSLALEIQRAVLPPLWPLRYNTKSCSPL